MLYRPTVNKVKLRNKHHVLFCRFAIVETNFVLNFNSSFIAILPKRDYVTCGYLLSEIHLSSVCIIRAPYSGVETFGNISSLLYILAIF